MGAIQQVLATTMPAGGGGSGDPYWANVSALLYFDGVDESATFTDETGKTWTVQGSPRIDTAEFIQGDASGRFQASGDYIHTASDAGFGFGAGDLTVEGYYKAVGLSGNRVIFETRTAANNGFAAMVSHSSYPNRLCYIDNTAGIFLQASTAFTGSFDHWAIVRSGTTIYGYLNGVQVFTGTDSRTMAAASTCFIADNYIGASQPAHGWIDVTRVTKGVCRYPSGTTFTPPTSFPNF